MLKQCRYYEGKQAEYGQYYSWTLRPSGQTTLTGTVKVMQAKCGWVTVQNTVPSGYTWLAHPSWSIPEYQPKLGGQEGILCDCCVRMCVSGCRVSTAFGSYVSSTLVYFLEELLQSCIPFFPTGIQPSRSCEVGIDLLCVLNCHTDDCLRCILNIYPTLYYCSS